MGLKSKRTGVGDGRTLRVEELECRRLLALNPTADEQHLMQLINRFRTNPTGEYSRLIASASPIRARDPVLQDDLDFAQVNGNTLRNELSRLSPSQPLAWNEAIRDFNRDHNQDMIRRGTHFHSDSTVRRNQLTAAGVNFRNVTGEKINAEVVYGYGKSVLHTYASYVIDWQRGGPGGMVQGRTHRVALNNQDFEQAGVGITNHNGSGNPPLGPRVNSAILANVEQPNAFVTGAIFQDRNSSRWYEPGEGIGNVMFTFTDREGTSFQTRSFGAGGYQIALPPGVYNATASGGGLRFTLRMNNISVGSENVWRNWIYDPESIPPDEFEPNNGRGGAAEIASDETLSGLGIHVASDQDYFRIRPAASGQLVVRAEFSHGAGDLQLELQASNGVTLVSSDTKTNSEQIEFNVSRNQIYYIRVAGVDGATHPNYRLVVNLPEPATPTANADRAVYSGASNSIEIDVLANDMNPDGDQLEPELVGTDSSFSIRLNKRVSYTPPTDFSGVHRTQYTVENEHGLQSARGEIAVFVVNFEDSIPWQNSGRPMDVNDDRSVTAIDALLAINALNESQQSLLPSSPATAREIFGFVDASGDGFLTAVDALLVVNQLSGEGEGESFADDGHMNSFAVPADIYFGRSMWEPMWESDEEEERLVQDGAMLIGN